MLVLFNISTKVKEIHKHSGKLHLSFNTFFFNYFSRYVVRLKNIVEDKRGKFILVFCNLKLK
jgi:hypothetical protein